MPKPKKPTTANKKPATGKPKVPAQPAAGKPEPKPEPKRSGFFPLEVRDACGEFTIHFETEQKRVAAANKIQITTRRQLTKPKSVIAVEGEIFFCEVCSVRVPRGA